MSSIQIGDFSAYVAESKGTPTAAIIVIQEIFGVNPGIRQKCDSWAKAGYLAVAPDLFWRIEPGVDITDQSKAEWDKAFSLYNVFDVDLGVKDIDSTIDAIRADDGCSGKVGSVGFCLGGLLAFLTATRTDVDAAVGYYGVGIEKYTGEADQIEGALMLSSGAAPGVETDRRLISSG